MRQLPTISQTVANSEIPGVLILYDISGLGETSKPCQTAMLSIVSHTHRHATRYVRIHDQYASHL